MKKYILLFALLTGTVLFRNTVEAQVSINVSINIGRQPAWGPVGYDYVDYYYFPDINCYFNVNLGLYYFFDGGMWISAPYLPYAYRNYDLYSMYKVVLVNVVDPWRYNYNHIRMYSQYRGYRSQPVIRDSRDNRYSSSRNNRIAWFSGNRDSNRDNRTIVYQSNNRNNSGRNNDRNNNFGNRTYNNNNNTYNNNNNARRNQTIDNRNYSNNNNNNYNNNNNRRRDDNVGRQQNSGENRQFQRNSSDNNSSRGRSNGNGAGTGMRSGSSRSESYAGSYEKRQGNHQTESSNSGRRSNGSRNR